MKKGLFGLNFLSKATVFLFMNIFSNSIFYEPAIFLSFSSQLVKNKVIDFEIFNLC